MTGTPEQSRYTHKECGGVTIWDLSGGFCTKCHTEGLDMGDVEPLNPCPHEAVFPDGRVPCTLPRHAAGEPHVYGDTLLPFDEETSP